MTNSIKIKAILLGLLITMMNVAYSQAASGLATQPQFLGLNIENATKQQVSSVLLDSTSKQLADGQRDQGVMEVYNSDLENLSCNIYQVIKKNRLGADQILICYTKAKKLAWIRYRIITIDPQKPANIMNMISKRYGKPHYASDNKATWLFADSNTLTLLTNINKSHRIIPLDRHHDDEVSFDVYQITMFLNIYNTKNYHRWLQENSKLLLPTKPKGVMPISESTSMIHLF